MIAAIVAIATLSLGGGAYLLLSKRTTGGETGGPPGPGTTSATTGTNTSSTAGMTTGTTSNTAGMTAGTTAGTTDGTTTGTTGDTAGTTGTTTGGQTGSLGDMVDDRFEDAAGSFTFVPPAGWDMRKDEADRSVKWSHPDDEKLGAMDLRVADSMGQSLETMTKSTEEVLKSKMSFEKINTTQDNLGSEPCNLIIGTVKPDGGDEMMLALALSVHNGKVVIMTMGAKKDAFTKAVPTLDASISTWRWK
jgi:hypothetical protein